MGMSIHVPTMRELIASQGRTLATNADRDCLKSMHGQNLAEFMATIPVGYHIDLLFDAIGPHLDAGPRELIDDLRAFIQSDYADIPAAADVLLSTARGIYNEVME
jgi:hypothetical protein